MTIYIYKAECGNAARIRFIGSDLKPHNIFIDSGYDRTFRQVIQKEIEFLLASQEVIDLWIISHIHEDHIGGALAYINAIHDGEVTDCVQKWFYNPPRKLPSNFEQIDGNKISDAKSIKQGDSLAKYLFTNNKVSIKDITTHLSVIDLFGLKLTILSPTTLKLQKLRTKYLNNIIPLEENENCVISEAKSSIGHDYYIPLERFDLSMWNEDNSIENGSSIACITELNKKTILWLADSHPSVIVNSLKELGYSRDNPLMCDYVNITHHGSKGNNSNTLYELIRCCNYIISANGENNSYLPTKECIARILRNPNRLPNLHYNFYCTYDNETLRNIFKIDGMEVFNKYNFTFRYLKLDDNFFCFNLLSDS